MPGDSRIESSMVAVCDEQTDPADLQDNELGLIQWALKRRGSLTIWFDPTTVWEASPSGKRGRQQAYSDAAIQTCLTLKVVFGMALRQTTGFAESLLKLAGLGWPVPDYSTLSRRQKTINVAITRPGIAKLLACLDQAMSAP